jgi:nucleoid-associated protein YgaU
MSYSGSLSKMKIKAFEKGDFKGKIGEFSVYINPASYSRSYKILYNDRQAPGSSGGSPDYVKTPSDTVKFELVFDGTGVVGSPLPGIVPFTSDGVKDQINKFMKLVFSYNGNIHSPNFLEISWATLLFKCRLSTLDMNYTMFKPDGTPLRARANAVFTSFLSETELELWENNRSPDLSHLVTVKAGDTLPLLCYGIYGSSVYYLEIARVNGLAHFRDLAPGMQLLFPPLQDSAT